MKDSKELIKQYSERIRKEVQEDIRIEYEDNCIILDGDKEELFITIYDENEARVYWCNNCFIFSASRNLFTSSDTYGEIVFEGKVTEQNLCDLVIDLLLHIKDTLPIQISEEEIGKIPSGYDTIKNYYIEISGNKNSPLYVLGNIQIKYIN